jgi:hypothetical protein
VLSPVCIALLMVVWGTLVTQTEHEVPVPRWAWALGWTGIVVALAVFMSDAWRALPGGRDAVDNALTTTINWPLISVALALMASPAMYHAIVLFTKKSPDGVIHPSSGRI